MATKSERHMQCCFTGHRPEKLLKSERAVKTALRAEIAAAVAEGYTSFITGMSRGVDLWAAELVLRLKRDDPQIRLLCAVPYRGFETRWPAEWQALYRGVLASADEVMFFYPAYTAASFHVRNRWMVDHSERLIAVFHGQPGGTEETIAYARRKFRVLRLIYG